MRSKEKKIALLRNKSRVYRILLGKALEKQSVVRGIVTENNIIIK
jgi:hypothetical protein